MTANPKQATQLQGALDLSNLGRAPEAPPGTYTCSVPDGCGLLMRAGAREHQTWKDCLATTVPYVQIALEDEAAFQKLATEFKRMQQQNRDLLAANQRLVTERDEALERNK